MARKKNNDELKIAVDLATSGFQNIQRLSKSGLISEKLIGFNSLLFVALMSINIASLFAKEASIFSLDFFFMFFLGAAISLILSLIYTPILETISNFSDDKIVDSLSAGLIILLISIPCAVAGHVFQILFFRNLSIGLIALQLVIVLLGAIINYFPKTTPNTEVNSSQVWDAIHKTASITGIISFCVTMITIIIDYFI